MTDDDLYSDLPEDKELAFLQLEENFRKELFDKCNQPNVSLAYMEYLNKTHAVACALELPLLEDMPDFNTGNAQGVYSGLSPRIENYIIQVKIRHGRRTNGYSVAPDA